MPNFLFAKAVVEILAQAGHLAYFAGGWVRDYLMNHPSDDIDIATSASVEEIQALFPKTIPVGINFGIVIVVHEGHSFEVATFRKDLEYKDGRRPLGIDKAEPKEDAKRRDFTINGLFFDPLNDEIIDYVDGKKDIEKKLIRAIGNAHDRFKEDRLRMVRAVRYATRFAFTIEESTYHAIKFHAEEILPSVAMERIWQEFKKMAKFSQLGKSLLMLHELGLLQRIFPSLKTVSTEEMKKRLKHVLAFPKNCPPIAELLELFPESSLTDIQNLCEYLKLSNEEKKLAFSLKHFTTMLNMPKSFLAKLELIEWAYLYADPHEDLCLAILHAKQEEADKKAFAQEHSEKKWRLKEAIRRIKEKDPLINSSDLLKEGIKPGILMGQLLKEAEKISINQGLQKKEYVIEKLKKSSIWPKM